MLDKSVVKHQITVTDNPLYTDIWYNDKIRYNEI